MSKFAVIIADLNSSELGYIVSTHRSEGAAIKAQPDAPGAYVAHRKPDGEWERYLDARDRRETPPAFTAAQRVRKSESALRERGGRRLPGGSLQPDAAAALDTLQRSGYAASATAVIARALLEAASKYF